MVNHIIYLMLIFLLYNFIHPVKALCYKQPVHMGITRQAVINSKKILPTLHEIGLVQAGKQLEDVDLQEKNLSEWIQHGADWEDGMAIRVYRADSPRGVMYNHFYNPINNLGYVDVPGVVLGQSLIERIHDPEIGGEGYLLNEWSYEMAKELYCAALTGNTEDVHRSAVLMRDGHELFDSHVPVDGNVNPEERERLYAWTLQALGHTLHLIQDASVPAHTRNDLHLREPYEKWTIGNIDYLADKKYFDGFEGSDPWGYWKQYPAMSAPDSFIDTNQLNESSLEPIPGPGQGLAEYSHANFMSEDTISRFTLPATPAKDGFVHDYANGDYTLEDMSNRNGKNLIVVYLKNRHAEIDHLLLSGVFHAVNSTLTWPSNLPDVRYTVDDSRVNDDYAKKLIPRAVGYSAGLIDYFFRGAIEVTLPSGNDSLQVNDDNTGYNRITLQAKNTSPAGEDLTHGNIKLSVRYKVPVEPEFPNELDLAMRNYPAPPPLYEQFILAGVNTNQNAVGREATELEFVLPGAGIPANAMEVRLQVVYRGQLGQEADGIATGGINIMLEEPIEISIPDTGYYALAKDPASDFRENITVMARNRTPGNLDMTGGSIELVVKYRNKDGDPFAARASGIDEYYTWLAVPESGNNGAIPRDTPAQLSFDLSSHPIPLNAVDLVMQVRYTDPAGQVTLTGLKDLSEPSPIDMFNTGDVVCINQQWYWAGSPEAVALVDWNGDGIAGKDESDVYAHDFKDVYWRFSAATAPAGANASLHDFKLGDSSAGEHRRLGFILTEYETNYNFSHNDPELIKRDASDPWHAPDPSYLRTPPFSGWGFENQESFSTDPACLVDLNSIDPQCFSRSISPLRTIRGVTTWNPFFLANPEDENITPARCYYGAIP